MSRPTRRLGFLALALALLTGGLTVMTVGVAGPAEAPRTQAPFTAASARGPQDVALPRFPPAALEPSTPVALAIPAIGVRSELGEVGLTADGALDVPTGEAYDLAAWFSGSPTPGQQGPAVIEGHLDRPDGSPSVFYRLGELGPGSRAEVLRADGRTAVFQVTEVARYDKAAFPTADVYGDLDHAGLRLLTCGGPQDADGEYRDNVVVYATLVDVRGA